MTAQKPSEAASRSPSSTAEAGKRKAWKKKTPVQVVLEQIEKVREVVTEKRAELKDLERQLQKLEEAKKLLEAS